MRKGILGNIMTILFAIIIASTLLYLNKQVVRQHNQSIPSAAANRTIIETPRNNAPMEEYTRYFQKEQLTVRNRTYTYFWREPLQPWPENIKFPLVMVMHGATGKSYGAKFLLTEKMQYQYPAFIFVPVLAGGRYWALPSDPPGQGEDTLDSKYALSDMVDMITNLAQQYPIDMSRIYAIGCSDGGTGAYGAARYYPHFFAATVPLSGSWYPEDAVHMNRIPMWIFHGQLDTIIPAKPAKAIANIAHSRGGKVHYTEFKNTGHNCPSPLFYSDKMWQWLFNQKRF